MLAMLLVVSAPTITSTSTLANSADEFSRGAWQASFRAAKRYAHHRAGQVSFSLVDTRGKIWSEGGSHRVPMASTYKVMLMISYLRKGSVRHRELTASEVSKLGPMIRESDNAAADYFHQLLGRAPLSRLARRAKMRDFCWRQTWGASLSTTRDQAIFMRSLRAHVPDRHWDFVKEQLSHIVAWQRWGVGKVRPTGWRLYFKGGWGARSGIIEHQIAMIARGTKKVGVSVFTEHNPSSDYGRDTLRGVFGRLVGHLG